MREPKKPKKDRTRDWCGGGGISIALPGGRSPHLDPDAAVRKTFLRCPDCNQRFEATIDRDGVKEKVRGYKTLRLPKHKAYGTKSWAIAKRDRSKVVRDEMRQNSKYLDRVNRAAEQTKRLEETHRKRREKAHRSGQG